MVAAQRLGAVAAALEHRAQLAPGGDAEVERGADALGGQRQAVAGRVADEEDAVLGGRPQPVRDPVALIAVGRQAQAGRQPHGRLLDVVARVERADPDAQLVARGERPAVAGADHALVDPELEVVAGPGRMHLQPAREARVRRLHQPGAEVALPAHRVDDQRRGHVAAVGPHHLAVPALHLRGLERRAGAVLRPQQVAQLAVVERRERPAQRPARRGAGRVHEQRAERLEDRGLEPQVAQPPGRRGARGRLALADLVAVQDEDVGARGAQLARDREPGERGSADQDVVVAADGSALGAALRGSDGHLTARIIGKAEAASIVRCLWKPL